MPESPKKRDIVELNYTLQEFVFVYLRKDLQWLEGFADALDSLALRNRVYSLRTQINRLENKNVDSHRDA